MTTEHDITCIVCPIGCKIFVKTEGDKVTYIDGEKCRRGQEYAHSEALDPKRVLTTSVLVRNGQWPLVSVKTSISVPKKMVFPFLEVIHRLQVNAPVIHGQILVKNILDTGIDLVATKTIQRK